jgi:hypothetical protein
MPLDGTAHLLKENRLLELSLNAGEIRYHLNVPLDIKRPQLIGRS